MQKYNGNIKLEVMNVSEHSYSPDYFDCVGQKKIKGIHITRSLLTSKTTTDLKFLEGINDKLALRVLLIDVDLLDASAIERLYLFENISDLSITNSYLKPFTLNLEKFKNLNTLTLAGNFNLIGLDKIKLKSLSVFQSKKLNINSVGNSIESLVIDNIKEIYFEELKSFSNIKKLILTKTQVESLDGISNLVNLEELELNYCSKLMDISALEKCEKIKKIYIEGTKTIADFMPLTALKELKDLTLFKCGNISSLAFINNIPSLERLLFTGTNIVDGDLTPCLRLKTAWSSLGRRNYNINVEDLPRG